MLVRHKKVEALFLETQPQYSVVQTELKDKEQQDKKQQDI